MIANQKDIIQVFEETVDSMRNTSIISNITDNGDGTFKIYCDVDQFVISEFVQLIDSGNLDGLNYQLQSINIDHVVINANIGTTFNIGGTIKANAPYYDFGLWVHGAHELTQKDTSNVYSQQKFPLFFLLLGFGTKEDVSDIYCYDIPNVSVYILCQSDGYSLNKERYDSKFKSEIDPLYCEFIQRLKANRDIVLPDPKRKIPREKKDYYYFGTENPANANPLNAKVEARQIIFENIFINYTTCHNTSSKNTLSRC